MVRSPTGVTGWVNRSWFSVISVICIVCVGNVGYFFVGAKVCLTTVFVVAIAGTIRLVFGLLFLSFEMTALALVVTWLFAVVTWWFGFFWILLCGLWCHSVYLQIIWSLQTIQFELPFKMWHYLFVFAILWMRLISRFLQVGRHFGIYKMLDDCLNGNSESIFR